jgi:type IV pilus assembly protein PilE
MNAQSHIHGFTLVELLISLSMASVLAATALPNYQNQVHKSRRADAMDAMAHVVQQQERFRSQNHSYAENLQALGLNADSAAGHYTLVLGAVSAQGFTLTAQPHAQGRQAQDHACHTITQVLHKGVLRQSAMHRNGSDSSAQCWPQ